MRTVVRHPNGVMVNGKVYRRDEFYAAEHVSLHEWLALGVLILGFLIYAAGIVAGLIWLARRWL